MQKQASSVSFSPFKSDRILPTVVLLASCNSARAVGISDQKFQALSGTLSNTKEAVSAAYSPLREESHQPRFDTVGVLIAGGALCTGSWIGNEGEHAYVITAAHCVYGDNKSEESNYTGQTMSFRTGDGRLVAQGVSTAYFRGYRGCSTDLAVVKMPLLTEPLTQAGKTVSPPVYDDDITSTQHINAPLILAGYGAKGTPTLGGVSFSGRVFGVGTVSQDSSGCLINHAATTDAWAFGAPGDSGSTNWQWRDGQFVGVGITSWWAGWNSRKSGHGRIAPHTPWLKKVFPNLNTVSRSRTLTENHPVQLGRVESQVPGTVYYVAGDNVQGPTSRKWVYPRGFTTLSVPMTNQATNATANVTLRAQRSTWCGWGEINNGVYCYPDATKGELKVWFAPSDNPGLSPGLYQSEFSLQARGWHDHSYTSNIKLAASILVGADAPSEGTVTESSAAMTVPYDSLVNGTVYYLSTGQTESTATSRVWHGSRNWTTLSVPVRRRDTNDEYTIHLRAQRNTGCFWTEINNGVYCRSGANYGHLRIFYRAEDNPHLPAGDYDSLFNLTANGWHSSFYKMLTFKLAVHKE